MCALRWKRWKNAALGIQFLGGSEHWQLYREERNPSMRDQELSQQILKSDWMLIQGTVLKNTSTFGCKEAKESVWRKGPFGSYRKPIRWQRCQQGQEKKLGGCPRERGRHLNWAPSLYIDINAKLIDSINITTVSGERHPHQKICALTGPPPDTFKMGTLRKAAAEQRETAWATPTHHSPFTPLGTLL